MALRTVGISPFLPELPPIAGQDRAALRALNGGPHRFLAAFWASQGRPRNRALISMPAGGAGQRPEQGDGLVLRAARGQHRSGCEGNQANRACRRHRYPDALSGHVIAVYPVSRPAHDWPGCACNLATRRRVGPQRDAASWIPSVSADLELTSELPTARSTLPDSLLLYDAAAGIASGFAGPPRRPEGTGRYSLIGRWLYSGSASPTGSEQREV